MVFSDSLEARGKENRVSDKCVYPTNVSAVVMQGVVVDLRSQPVPQPPKFSHPSSFGQLKEPDQ